MRVTFEIVKKAFSDKNCTLLSTEYKGSTQPLEFLCTNCGKPWHISWTHFKAGRNKNLLCPSCSHDLVWTQNKKTPLDDLKKEIEHTGAEIVGEFQSVTKPLEFRCSKCKHTFFMTIDNWRKGQNPHLLCKVCRGDRIYDRDLIVKIAQERGSKVLEDRGLWSEPVTLQCLNCQKQFKFLPDTILNDETTLCTDCRGITVSEKQIKQKVEDLGAKFIEKQSNIIYYICPKCEKQVQTFWGAIKNRTKPLVCSSCSPSAKKTLSELKQWFFEHNSELLSENYVNNKQKLQFKCTFCGGIGESTWSDLQNGQNPKLLCSVCNLGAKRSSVGNRGRRMSGEKPWYTMVQQFFNVQDSCISHHVKFYSQYPEDRTSITNGYPIVEEYHKVTFEYNGMHDPLHRDPNFRNPNMWLDDFKPESLKGKKVLPLWEQLRTEIIYLEDKEVLSKKIKCKEQGILYIPIFYDEAISKQKCEILYSMLKIRLMKKYDSIFDYTNTEFNRFFARKLTLAVNPNGQKKFLEENHIQGFAPCQYSLALMDGENIIQLMTFIKSRFSDKYEWELLRLATQKNSVVIGGTQRLWKAFLQNKNPQSTVSYCDLRFADLMPEETVYTRLGFSFDGQTKSSYRWFNREYNKSLSRISTQKHKLNNLLECFDSTLSEDQNMRNAGYIKFYDCGNYRFVWRKS